MEPHEFCECFDKTKLEHHALWDAANEEVLVHIAIDSLKKALCSDCFDRLTEAELLRQFIGNHNWDSGHFGLVIIDLIKWLDLLKKWRETNS